MNLRKKKRIYIIKYIYIITLKNPVSAYLMISDSRTFNLGYTNGGEDTRISVNSLSNVCRLLYMCVNSILVDPARGHCYWDSIKPCELNGVQQWITMAYGSVKHE